MNAEAVRVAQPVWKFWHWEIHWQILLWMVIGGFVGWRLGQWALTLGSSDASATEVVRSSPIYLLLKLMGDLFLNGLKLIVIPLVFSSIALAVASISQAQGFGRLGLKTLAWFLSTSLLAVLIGLALVNIIQPGESRSGTALLSPERIVSLQEQFGSEQIRLTNASETARKKLEQAGGGVVERILSVFREMVPANAVAAAVEMNLLGLICMAMVAGYFLPRLPERQRGVMMAFWEGVYELGMMTTGLVLKFAPWGIAALLATTVAENYASLAAEARFGELVSAILWFAAVTVTGLMLHAFVVLPLLMLFFRIPPVRHFRAMIPQLITSFSTASSNASLPVTIDCVERRAGISPRISSFVLPLGATANMNGTALYECTAAIFVVQLFGYELDISRQFMVVLIALMTSIGVAGVPSASLVAIVVILQAVGRQIDAPIPLESGLAILLVFDRPLDMLRTSLNVFSDTVGAAVIARSEGESVSYPSKPFEDPSKLLPDQ